MKHISPKHVGYGKAIADVYEEILCQVCKWGTQNHSPADWQLILDEEVGETAKEVNEIRFRGKTTEEYRKEMVQVAAVAISAIECLDRNAPEGS